MNRKEIIVGTLLVLAALVLRFVFLGYSDYQGDEIKSFYRGATFDPNLFLTQRKGPVQFLVTWVLRDVSGDFANRALVRAPFALAGFLACIFFFLFVKTIATRRIAMYASLFFITNGFLIAFARISQYQSFVILFMVLALYFAALLQKMGRIRYLYLSMLAWAVSFLAHYDGVFVFPMLAALILRWVMENGGIRRVWHKLVIPALLFIVTTGAFYVPFVWHLSESTLRYWGGRITGEGSSGVPSSLYLFSVYQPIAALYIYIILGSLGLVMLAFLLAWRMSAGWVRLPSRRLAAMFPPGLRGAADRHPQLDRLSLLGLLLWFVIAYVFLEVFVTSPGTHIYVYLMPLTILMGVALWHAQLVLTRQRPIARHGFSVALALCSALLFLQSYAVFVDHSTEYPWQPKRFLIWTLVKPSLYYNVATFGFPYYRHWDEVGQYIKEDARSGYYYSTEKLAITSYHIPLVRSSPKAGYFVYVANPQTYHDDVDGKRFRDWMASNQPVASWRVNGTVKTAIYLLPDSTGPQ